MKMTVANEIPTFSARLKEAQAEAGLKNEALARDIGISVRLLQVWRSGTGLPSASRFAALCAVLDRDASWFFPQPDEREAA